MEATVVRRRTVDVATVVGLLVVVRVGFASWYSSALLQRSAFEAQYRHGVYRHRVLGREAVLWIQRAIGDPLGEHLVLAGRHPLAGGMATAGLLVDVVAAAVLALLIGRLLDRRGVDGAPRALVVVTFAVLVAVSATTVTPYDLPALALALGALVVLDARPPWDLSAIVLVAMGVATRESSLVAVAAMLAAGAGAGRRRTIAWASAIVGAATYLGLVLASGDGGDGGGGGSLWAQVALRGNVGRLYGWVGLAAMVGGWLLWRRSCALAGLDGSAERAAVARLWLWASPYAVVALVTGYWFEVRLLLPMVVAESWVRTRPSGTDREPDRESGQGHDGTIRQSSRPTSEVTVRSSTVTVPAGES